MPADVLHVSLHGSLYDLDAARQVAEGYGGLARVELEPGAYDLTVRFHDVDPDVTDVLVDHFCNHVLVETVRRHNQAEGRLRGEVA